MAGCVPGDGSGLLSELKDLHLLTLARPGDVWVLQASGAWDPPSPARATVENRIAIKRIQRSTECGLGTTGPLCLRPPHTRVWQCGP